MRAVGLKTLKNKLSEYVRSSAPSRSWRWRRSYWPARWSRFPRPSARSTPCISPHHSMLLLYVRRALAGGMPVFLVAPPAPVGASALPPARGSWPGVLESLVVRQGDDAVRRARMLETPSLVSQPGR